MKQFLPQRITVLTIFFGHIVSDHIAAAEPPNLIWIMADDLFADEALKFVDENKTGPSFLYWSMVSACRNRGEDRRLPQDRPHAIARVGTKMERGDQREMTLAARVV